jgi:hypothetical protein
VSTQSDDPRGSGWLLFAATMLGLTGSLNALIGLAAIGQSRVFAGDAAFVIGNLRAWGWILLLVGVAQVAAAFGIGGRAPWGRWSGIGLAGLNILGHVVFAQAYPFWSLIAISLDVLVIYALTVYGGPEFERASSA